jgi:hypothetical protein
MGNKTAKPQNIVSPNSEGSFIGTQTGSVRSEEASRNGNPLPISENLLIKFKHLLSNHESRQEPIQEPRQEPTREPIQEPRQEPRQEPIQEPRQEPWQEPWQESRHNEENTNLLIKFKHLLKSDDVEDYIAEITTEENGKVTEKPKRIKIGDFKKLYDA